MKRIWLLVGVLVCLVILFAVGKSLNHRNEEESSATETPDAKRTVVVYTALDRVFSEPIFSEFERETGVKVLAKYDTESTKTIGLVNAIRAEADRPRCDVFWNNEIVGTIRLKNENLLQQYRPQAAADYPEIFKDPEGYWTGFAARARVLIVNTDIVKQDEMPDSIFDLADENWKVRVQTMAAMDLLAQPLDYGLIRAVSENLNDSHWPVRVMVLSLLSKSDGSGFKQVLDWTAQHDSESLVRDMAIALGGEARQEPEPVSKTGTTPVK